MVYTPVHQCLYLYINIFTALFVVEVCSHISYVDRYDRIYEYHNNILRRHIERVGSMLPATAITAITATNRPIGHSTFVNAIETTISMTAIYCVMKI